MAAAPPGDIPSSIDLRDAADAREWARTADSKRPWRDQLRGAIAGLLGAATPPARRILELGAGPGQLAERILRSCAVERYTLFDFSQPMLDLARERVGHHPAVRFVLGDFKQPGWACGLDAPFDAVVTMQAVHELRHKRHVPVLYRQIHDVLLPGGILLVCDHVPPDDSARLTSLHSTEQEQHAALAGAGFSHPATEVRLEGLYLCSAQRGSRAVTGSPP